MTTKFHPLPRSINRNVNFTRARTSELCAKLLEPYGLTLPQWVILSLLWREGDLPLTELAKVTGNKLPATSRLINRMIGHGLLSRKQDTRDARLTIITTSDTGDALRHLQDFHERVNEILLDGFSEEEEQAAYALLERIEANARKAME